MPFPITPWGSMVTLLNFDFQKCSDSSNQLFRFAFVNTGSFVNCGGCGYML